MGDGVVAFDTRTVGVGLGHAVAEAERPFLNELLIRLIRVVAPARRPPTEVNDDVS